MDGSNKEQEWVPAPIMILISIVCKRYGEWNDQRYKCLQMRQRKGVNKDCLGLLRAVNPELDEQMLVW